MSTAAVMARAIEEIKEEAGELSEETAGYITPEKKPEFERTARALINILSRVSPKEISDEEAIAEPEEFAMLNSHVAYLTRIAHKYGSEDFSRIVPRWRKFYAKCGALGRRNQLLSETDEHELRPNLWWEVECGGIEDLPFLQHLDNSIPTPYGNIPSWIDVAKERIIDRANDTFDELKTFFGLSDKEFARITGSPGGEQGGRLSASSILKLKQLQSIKESLEAQFKKNEITRWLHAPNQKFSGLTPVQALSKGESERILGLLIRLEEGIPG